VGPEVRCARELDCTLCKYLYTVQMGLREENTERRRERILAVARELVARDGMSGWPMRKLARAAHVSVPTLYNLFGSKEDIRRAMCAGFFDDLDRGLEGKSLERPLEQSLAFVTEAVDHVVDRAALTRPVLLAQEHGRGGERLTTPLAIERQRAAIQAAMDQGDLHGDLRADLLAAQAHEGFLRAALLWARGDLDAAGFRDKAMYSACVCLLAAATDDARPELLRITSRLERKLARKAKKQAAKDHPSKGSQTLEARR
jgi:AcrR family transcriptional regulator